MQGKRVGACGEQTAQLLVRRRVVAVDPRSSTQEDPRPGVQAAAPGQVDAGQHLREGAARPVGVPRIANSMARTQPDAAAAISNPLSTATRRAFSDIDLAASHAPVSY